MKTIKILSLTLVLLAVGCSSNTELEPYNEVNASKLKEVKQSYQRPISENVNSIEWLKSVPGSVYVSQISIPGTHESAALYEGLRGTAKCQDLKIDEQLNIGVRYLDIRCRHMNNKFRIFHGIADQKQSFSDILNSCKSFLRKNPSEFIFMSVKEEYRQRNSTRKFYETFEEYLEKEAKDCFYIKNRVPKLQEVRGKIVLIRRFSIPEDKELGIQANDGWNDNRNNVIIENGVNKLIIQDKYKFSDNNLKWNLITSQFQKSFSDKSSQNLYLNNTSGYTPGWFGIPNITRVSNEINPKLDTYLYNLSLSSNRKKKLGIVGVDFVTAQRAKQILLLQDY